MKLFVTLTLFTLSYAAKLDNNYLPPNSAKSAGGNGQILSIPSGGGNGNGNGHANGNGHSNGNGNNHQANGGSRSADASAAILRYDNQNNGDGSYQFTFETENKIQQEEQGQLKNSGSEQEAIEVRGSYSYVGPDGQTITVNYVADENGFQPSGDHLPTPPPIPEAILRSLEINAAEEANGNNNNGYSSQQNGNGNNNQNGYKY